MKLRRHLLLRLGASYVGLAAPMDFNAWFEVYLGGRWFTFDARHNMPRIGRVVIARGRDATDVAMLSSFGPHTLQRFEVITEEIEDPVPSPAFAAGPRRDSLPLTIHY